MKILNFGSLNYDYTYIVDHMVRPGETLSAKRMELHCGGKGLNQSIALSRAGVPVYHAGMIGNDGEELLKVCREDQIDTRFVGSCDTKCGHAMIQVNEQGENCILLYAGANWQISMQQIKRVLGSFEAGDMIILQNEVNELATIIDLAYERKMKIVLNPSPFNDVLHQCHLEKVSVFVVNEIEGNQITGKKDPEDILDKMEQQYPCAEVVLTLGIDGSIYSGNKSRYQCDSYSVKAVDTTAAGDTFLGYYIAGIVDGKSIPDALKQASAASAIAVTKRGAAVSIPKKIEVDNFLRIHG
ncbi:MAG: ribokinase [Lachnospiraceae bacterium]|nr:ribokinase [Lachnospiraceae bacterium]